MKKLHLRRNLILSVSLVLVAGFLSTSLISYFLARTSVREQIVTSSLPLTSDNIYSEIQRDLIRPVFISSLMAQDTFLRDWVVDGEQDAGKIAKYLQEIKTSYGAYTCFFVSDATHRYYYFDGILKTVAPDVEADKWYFRVRSMEAPYEINVDPDMAHKNTMTIFINYKVFDYEENFIGATGVGLQVGALIDLMRHYGHKYGRNIYFADDSGNIMLSSSAGFTNLADIAGMASIRDAVLSKTGGSHDYSRDGRKVFVNSRYVDELGWYLVVEEMEGAGSKRLSHALFLNLAICGIITVFVILLVALSIASYEKTRKRQEAQIVEQRNQLEQANHRKSQLLHVLCHDLSNPFGALISSLGSRSEDSGLLDEMMDEINRSLKNGMGTIELVRKIRAMEEGKLDLPIASIPLKPLIEESAALLKNRLQEKEISLEVDVLEDITVSVETVSFNNSVINNLLTNAIKFSRHNSMIRVKARRLGDSRVEVTVVDEGVGMPASIRDVLFDFEASTSRPGTDGETGTGFGMPLVKMFVEAYGGSLRVESLDIEESPDHHGTTVSMVLNS